MPSHASLTSDAPFARPSALGTTSLLDASYAVLRGLRLPNGLYLASPNADYRKVWLRDNVYEALPFADKPTGEYTLTCHGILDILRRHEWKIDRLVRGEAREVDDHVHPRYHAETLREFAEPWGNKQHDAIGAVLFGIAEGLGHGKPALRDARDRRCVTKLIRMLGAVEYWHDADHGMWEEAPEVHASSIGAVVGGLRAIREHGFDVPEETIARGERALRHLLPRESRTKRTDLALLSLCYPYRGVVSDEQATAIVRDVERHLLRARGAIRYEGDSYYSTLAEEHGRGHPREFYRGSEAEWTFALPWLSLVHRRLGDEKRADEYLERALSAQTSPGCMPELYYARTAMPNPNTPLGWSVAMLILALEAASRA